MTLDQWVAVTTIAVSAVTLWAAFTGAVRRIIKREVSPKLVNGSGETVTDYAHQARDLAKKAVELATVADARTARLELKLDAHILAAEENGELAKLR